MNQQTSQVLQERRHSATQRLFIALWPDPELRRHIASLVSQQDVPATGRWTPIDNVHITLVFLGEVDEQARKCINQAAGKIRGHSFRLLLDRIGYWSRPQILWLAPTHVPAELQSLYENIKAGIGACGVSMDERPYKPHLTLARKIKRPPPKFKFQPLPWHVTEYSLMESLPSPNGGINYQQLASWQLDRQGLGSS